MRFPLSRDCSVALSQGNGSAVRGYRGSSSMHECLRVHLLCMTRKLGGMRKTLDHQFHPFDLEGNYNVLKKSCRQVLAQLCTSERLGVRTARRASVECGSRGRNCRFSVEEWYKNYIKTNSTCCYRSWEAYRAWACHERFG